MEPEALAPPGSWLRCSTRPSTPRERNMMVLEMRALLWKYVERGRM
jgi:hypothetical protein